MTPVLETHGLTKRFGGLTAVNKVDLVVPERNIASVIGPNGAGKTTFFNCITGFYTPDEGTALFKGQSIFGLGPDRIAYLGISRTYQNIRLFQAMSALENVLVGHHPRMKSGLIGAIFRPPGTIREEEELADPRPGTAGTRRARRQRRYDGPQSALRGTAPVGDCAGAGQRSLAAVAR